MMYLRACFRCGGDVFLERDTYGAFFKCLQCGFARDIPTMDERSQSAGVNGVIGTAIPDQKIDADAA